MKQFERPDINQETQELIGEELNDMQRIGSKLFDISNKTFDHVRAEEPDVDEEYTKDTTSTKDDEENKRY